MLCSMIRKQKGVSMSGMLMWSVILVLVSILGMKLIPVYIEYASIIKTLESISNDKSLQQASPIAIRQSFDRRAQIDNIDVVRGRDIKINNEKGNRVLSVNYSVKVPLVANISLYIDFEAESN